MDKLGDRIKSYERIHRKNFIPKIPIIVRVDGRAFHTWTRACQTPFDYSLIESMSSSAVKVAEDSGAAAFYCQSDEVTFLYLDNKSLETQQWFGGCQNKIESISAAAMTAHFNVIWLGQLLKCGVNLNEKIQEYKPAIFDGRGFQCPINDVPNVFLWRIRDWQRNSLNMFCRKFFSDKQLNGKNAAQRHELLHSIGRNWADLPEVAKNGTFWTKEFGVNFSKLNDYASINEFLKLGKINKE